MRLKLSSNEPKREPSTWFTGQTGEFTKTCRKPPGRTIPNAKLPHDLSGDEPGDEQKKGDLSRNCHPPTGSVLSKMRLMCGRCTSASSRLAAAPASAILCQWATSQAWPDSKMPPNREFGRRAKLNSGGETDVIGSS